MTKAEDTWGIVSTIKAPVKDILNFAAHHLDLGASRIHIYLDDDNTAAFEALSPHPALRVTLCNDAYWQDSFGRRPYKHQLRQSANAMHAYGLERGVSWLAHIDGDELLWPTVSLSAQLSALPADCQTARVRPIEVLADDASGQPGITCFKACHINRDKRSDETITIYPNFGPYLNGGFLSHTQGKVFFRSGIQGLNIRIHNVFLKGAENPGMRVLHNTELCHLHAPNWDAWIKSFQYRHRYGAYRQELRAPKQAQWHGFNLHRLFAEILADQGQTGLQQFFLEVCTATPALRHRLKEHDRLRELALDLENKRLRYFHQGPPEVLPDGQN